MLFTRSIYLWIVLNTCNCYIIFKLTKFQVDASKKILNFDICNIYIHIGLCVVNHVHRKKTLIGWKIIISQSQTFFFLNMQIFPNLLLVNYVQFNSSFLVYNYRNSWSICVYIHHTNQ